MTRQHFWTDEDVALVRQWRIEERTWREIGDHFGVTRNAVAAMFWRQKPAQRARRWSKADCEKLRELVTERVPPMRNKDIAVILGFSTSAVTTKRHRMGLNEGRPSPKEIVDLCVDEFGLTIEQTANRVGRSEEYVRRMIAYG